jgi:hypothetical protein
MRPITGNLGCAYIDTGVSGKSRVIAEDNGKKTETTRSGTKVVNMGFKFRMKY